MPNVDEDLSEGLALTEDENQRYALDRVFHCSGLTGASPPEIFAQALTLTSGGTAHTGGNVPAAAESLTINGHKLYAVGRRLDPFPPNEATVTVNYKEFTLSLAGYGPTIIEVSSTVEQTETEFDADERAKPFLQRKPLEVVWDQANVTPGAQAKKKTPRVPLFDGKGVRRYRRWQNQFPETLAETYVGMTNVGAWKGLSQDQAMCIGIVGTNQTSGAGLWDTSYEFSVDKKGLFRAIARFIDESTGQPVWVDDARLLASNGIKEIRVQGRADFNALQL